MTRVGLVHSIAEALRKHGASVHVMWHPVDLVVGYRGRTILMATKSRPLVDQQLQPIFRDWTGGELVAVKSVRQAVAVLGDKQEEQ